MLLGANVSDCLYWYYYVEYCLLYIRLITAILGYVYVI
jgi:hypothetical protein